MLDPASGEVPNLGANDGALILPLSSAEFNDFRPTVQAAARAFLRTGLPPGDWDELSVWLGLPSSTHTADSAAYAADHLRSRELVGVSAGIVLQVETLSHGSAACGSVVAGTQHRT